MTTTEIDKYDNSCYNFDDMDDQYPNWKKGVKDNSPEEDDPTLVVQLTNDIDPNVDLINSLYDVDDNSNLMDVVDSLQDLDNEPIHMV